MSSREPDIDKSHGVKQALRESEERLRLLSDNIPNGMVYQVELGEDGSSRRFTYLSAGVERLHGITAAEGMRDANAIYGQVMEEDRPVLAKWEAESLAAMSTFRAEFRVRRPSGEIRWVAATSSPRRLANNHVVWDGFELDITQSKLLEKERETLLGDLKERIKELNCLYSLSSIMEIPGLSVEGKLQKMAETLPPAWRHAFVCCARITIDGDEYETAGYAETRWKQASDVIVNGKRVGRVEVCYLEERPDADEGPFALQERSLLNASAELLGRFLERVRAEEALKESERRSQELSITDDLTQLHNLRHFYARLAAEIERANRYEQPVSLILMDVDDFKAFNDSHGHLEGDQVLIRLGQIIKRCVRKTDSAYRYGGEEFVVILPVTTGNDAAVTAERIRTEFRNESFSPVPGSDVHLTLSLGITQYVPHEEMKVFVRRVDHLMYRAKKDGKDKVCCES